MKWMSSTTSTAAAATLPILFERTVPVPFAKNERFGNCLTCSSADDDAAIEAKSAKAIGI